MSKNKLSQNTKAIVTGAGSGLGKAFALELSIRGGDVVVSDINLALAQETVEEITSLGGRAFAVECDVSKLEQMENLALKAEQWLGRSPNFVINNAGAGLGGDYLEDISMADWQWILGINLLGVIHGCHVFVPKLRKQGEGVILNVASAASFGAAPMMAAYNASKAAVLSISETLSAELSGSGVSAAVMCPTFIKTNIVQNSKMDDELRSEAQGFMNNKGMEPELAVKKTLDGIDKGKIYLLPQLDARMTWAIKRLAPSLFTRGMGIIGRKISNKINHGEAL